MVAWRRSVAFLAPVCCFFGAGLQGFWRRSAGPLQTGAMNRPPVAYDGTGLTSFSRPAPRTSQILPRMATPPTNSATRPQNNTPRGLSRAAWGCWRVDDGARTHDTRNHNPMLYQLNYIHHVGTAKLRIFFGIPKYFCGVGDFAVFSLFYCYICKLRI